MADDITSIAFKSGGPFKRLRDMADGTFAEVIAAFLRGSGGGSISAAPGSAPTEAVAVQGVASGTPIAVGGTTTNPSSSFTRPGTTPTYASGQLVANSATAGSVVFSTLTVARVAGGSGMLRRMKLHKSSTTTTNASFRVHLFRTAPVTVTNGDTGTFSVSGVADYVGAFDVTIDRAFTDGAAGFGVPVVGSDISTKLASGTTLAWALEAKAAYVGVSGETFTVTADDLQD